VNLPPELAALFEVLGEVASGGESDVLLVRRRDSDKRRAALKIYRHGLEPDPDALAVIRALPHEHVVEIYDCGRSTAGWWEEQEYIEHGSLADLFTEEGPKLASARLSEVLVELTNALDAVHPVLHRDVKPTNIFVRTIAPLDLVLGDFGLARSTAFTHIVSTVAGSLAYQSPEALDGGASVARDWWAVGMIIAEGAIGRHPFLDPELGWPPAAEMRIALTTRPVPLDGVDDERVRLLCRGLLTRDPRQRWGASQIRSWLDGESPAVADESAVRTRGVSVQPFVFAGARAATPEALAPLLAQHWDDALRLVSGAASQAPDYVRLAVWLQEHDDRAALRVLEQGAQDRSFARRLFRLLRVLDPSLPPSFRGCVVDRQGLVALATSAAIGDEQSQVIVYDLYELGIIGELARDEQRGDLIGIEEEWRAEVELIPRLRDQLGALGQPLDDEAVVRAVRARVLAALLDSDVREELVAAAGDSSQPALQRNSEARDLFEQVRGDGSQPIRLIAALAAVEPARERYEHERAEREAAERAATERREATERAERERRFRNVRIRDTTILVVSIAVVATVWPAAALGDLLSRSGPFRDGGAVLLRQIGFAQPILGVGYWATGAVPVLALAALLLCLRTQFRAHRVALAAIPVCAIASGVLLLLLPGMRDSAWAHEMGRIGIAVDRGECTLGESVAYRLSTGVRQPIAVGPSPRCQLVSRLSVRRGHAIWQKWIPKIRISRIHKYDNLFVVGGTYGGRRSADGRVVGARLVVAGIGPLSGRELWRRSCGAPGDGAHAIAFAVRGSGKHRLEYVRLRCATGRSIRLQPRTGRVLHNLK
jgi:hypothetical protein